MICRFEAKTHAQIYAKYRPSYTQEIISKILNFAAKRNLRPPLDHVVDIGCGNGQATKLYSPYAKKITGIDPSQNQIREVIKSNQYANISYQVGVGEDIPFANESVNIVNCTTAIHWLDFKKFFTECNRVLKPNGCVALFSYDIPNIKQIGKNIVFKHHNLKEIQDITYKKQRELQNSLLLDPLTKYHLDRYKYIYEMLISNSKQYMEMKMPDRC